jgi:hypothetical protein
MREMLEQGGATRLICVNVGTRREPTMPSHHGRHRMTRISANTTEATPAATSSAEALLSLADPLLEAQRAQWAAWQSWQQSLVIFHKDFWEQWAVRCAGGLPFDG